MNNIEKILTTVSSEIGYLEKRSNTQLDDKTANAGNANYTKYACVYKKLWSDDYQAQPWCAVFVSYIFYIAFRRELFPHFAYCPTGVNNFKKVGQWITAKPLAGDVIFFKDSSGIAYHVGIVEKVDNYKVYTIEGNTSLAAGVVGNGGCVARKNYDLNYGGILGYGRPKYEIIEMENEMSKSINELEEKHSETTVKSAIETLIIAQQSADWKVAGSDWLHANCNLSDVHNQNEPLTFGVLGMILSKFIK
jgi:hypothetical protein